MRLLAAPYSGKSGEDEGVCPLFCHDGSVRSKPKEPIFFFLWTNMFRVGRGGHIASRGGGGNWDGSAPSDRVAILMNTSTVL